MTALLGGIHSTSYTTTTNLGLPMKPTDDVLVRARAHDFWYRDRMIAEDLMFEIVTLRQKIVDLQHELDELYTDRRQDNERRGGCY